MFEFRPWARKRNILADADNAIALTKVDRNHGRPRLLRELIVGLPPAEREAIERSFSELRHAAAEMRKVEHRRRPAK